MAEVTITINGRTYKMSCDEGQEKHLLGLAEQVSGYVDEMQKSVGQVGDTRLLLMAAIMVADELGEAKRRMVALEADIEHLKGAREAAATRFQDSQNSITRTLDAAAKRIETMAESLNGG
ncbi:MAG TPA: cell division protein ZapA [Hyphomicrobiales bacterium]|nr:cell division protein ZapA [Hyphomicrobiales bacterium]